MYHNNCIAMYYWITGEGWNSSKATVLLLEATSFKSANLWCVDALVVAWTSFTSFRFRNQTFVQRYNDKKKDTPPAWPCPGGGACGAGWQRWWMSGPPCLNIAPWPTCRRFRRPRTFSCPPAARNVREGERGKGRGKGRGERGNREKKKFEAKEEVYEAKKII